MASLIHAGNCQPKIRYPDGKVECLEKDFYVIKDEGGQVELFQRMTGRSIKVSSQAEVIVEE